MKLTAVALATVLWVAVAAEEPTTEQVTIGLQVSAPVGRSLVGSLPAIRGMFSGPARELLKLYANPPTIHLAVPDTVDSLYRATLTTAQVEMPKHVDVRAQAIEPRSVALALTRRTRELTEMVPAKGDSVSERVLMGVPVTLRGDRTGWTSEPPAVIVTVRGPTARLARLTRDSLEVGAVPEGNGRPETVHLRVVAPIGIDAAAMPDTAVVQRSGRA